jgi:hypothetical protein
MPKGVKGFQRGRIVSPEVRKKIGDAHRGKVVSGETRIKQSKSLTGRKLSEKHKKHIGEAVRGRKYPPEFGLAISKRLTGKKLSEEHKAKLKANHVGKTGWRKVNPVSPTNELARKSKAYSAWRTAVFERDNYTCVLCQQVGGRLVADHIKPFAYFIGLRFKLDNGRTLCVPCHEKTDTYGYRAIKNYAELAC